MQKLFIFFIISFLFPLIVFSVNLNWFYNSDFSNFTFGNMDFWSKLSEANYTAAAANAMYFNDDQDKSKLEDEFNLAKGVMLFHLNEYASSLDFLFKVNAFDVIKNVYIYEDYVYLENESKALVKAKEIIPEVINNLNSIVSSPDSYQAWIIAEASNILLLKGKYKEANILSLKAYNKANDEDDVTFLDIYMHQRMNILNKVDSSDNLVHKILFLDSYLSGNKVDSINSLNFNKDNKSDGINTNATEPGLVITLTKLYLFYLQSIDCLDKQAKELLPNINSLLALDGVMYENILSGMNLTKIIKRLNFQKYYSDLKNIQGKLDHSTNPTFGGS